VLLFVSAVILSRVAAGQQYLLVCFLLCFGWLVDAPLQADDMEATSDPDSVGPIVDILTSLEDEDTASSSDGRKAGSSSADGTSSSNSAEDTSRSSSSSSSATSSSGNTQAGAASSSGSSRQQGPVGRGSSSRGRSALRKYIEGFDQAAMIDTAR